MYTSFFAQKTLKNLTLQPLFYTNNQGLRLKIFEHRHRPIILHNYYK
ncbi:hypothetical protein M23134_01179 [Microscilla marina ATCC 23134]|uniref:Uncharacterized protein n=1 Tax=Microscilla marina ATCC 23134 TaxID=313606 RepID=A1ZFT1_MICM2|nr:hypothetical protein M23134_01179 [Microscilla marina ATCC 23134]